MSSPDTMKVPLPKPMNEMTGKEYMMHLDRSAGGIL